MQLPLLNNNNNNKIMNDKDYILKLTSQLIDKNKHLFKFRDQDLKKEIELNLEIFTNDLKRDLVYNNNNNKTTTQITKTNGINKFKPKKIKKICEFVPDFTNEDQEESSSSCTVSITITAEDLSQTNKEEDEEEEKTTNESSISSNKSFTREAKQILDDLKLSKPSITKVPEEVKEEKISLKSSTTISSSRSSSSGSEKPVIIASILNNSIRTHEKRFKKRRNQKKNKKLPSKVIITEKIIANIEEPKPALPLTSLPSDTIKSSSSDLSSTDENPPIKDQPIRLERENSLLLNRILLINSNEMYTNKKDAIMFHTE
jgi:hypothetical protein